MKLIQSDNNICCKDILQSLFDLNDFDFEVYNQLREMNESRADFLAKKMNKERSTIYRSLQKLTLCGLCKKITKTIDTGGYYHVYLCNDIKNVKEARLGRNDNDTLKTVEEINPHIILLGPDQKYSVDILMKGLKEKGLNHIEVRRLENYYNKYELHSSSLIKQKIIERFKEKN